MRLRHPSRRTVLAAALLGPGLASSAAAAALAPHTLDELLAEPSVTDAAISPDGAQLAVLRQQIRGETARAYVTLHAVSDMDGAPVAIDVGDFQVDQVEWANNERLLIWITAWKDAKGRPYGSNYFGVIIPAPLRRVISVGLDGKDPVFLFADAKAVMRRAFDAARVVDLMPDDPAHVIMQAWDPRRAAFNLYEVDVYSGGARIVDKGLSATQFWITQRGVPMLRMDANTRGTVVSVFGRSTADADWTLVKRTRRNEWDRLPDFDVLGPTDSPGVFLVLLRGEGEDTRAVRTFDLSTMTLGAAIGARTPQQDVDSVFIDEKLSLVAIAARADRLEYQFLDPTLGSHHRAVDAALGRQANVRLYDLSHDHRRVLFKATGPREPGAFHLYDRDTRRLHLVAATRPALNPARLAGMEIVKFKARDGQPLTAYLSVPPNAAARDAPMVVMPHGGPESRDSYDFDPFAQALAARGWLVLQPNFRGSDGYGRAFAEAGRRRWGDLMQTDIEDAVAKIVASGQADPRRIAIFGASYGGYAAQMGPILRPDLYRCSVSVAGISDLLELLKYEREDGEDTPSARYWTAQLGDPRTDTARLRAASPRQRASELKAPLLLMHGELDAVVPIRQSQLMAEAMRQAGHSCEYAVIPGVGHRGWPQATLKFVLDKACAFIGQHI